MNFELTPQRQAFLDARGKVVLNALYFTPKLIQTSSIGIHVKQFSSKVSTGMTFER